MSMMKHNVLLLLVAMTPIAGHAQTTHTVTQVGTSFSPSSITVEAGDTVQWVWTSGIHTVTNGTGAADGSAGSLFDVPLSSGSPSFAFTFDDPGVVPYFCRPHEGFGMTGNITVEQATDAPVAPQGDLHVRGVEPNPFNPRTSLRFSLARDNVVDVDVYDVRGRIVRRLASDIGMEAGDRALQWNGRDDAGREVASGVYRFVVRTAGSEQVVNGVLVR